jgi:hypothetical protein
MKIRVWLALIGFITSALSASADFWSVLFPHEFQVITNAEVLPEGKEIPRASADRPIYYIGVSAGYQDLGGIVAGDKLPKKEEMIKVITKVLDKQGYKLATNKNPPTLVIMYSWGTLYTEKFHSANIDFPQATVNNYQILEYLGYSRKSGSPTWLEKSFPELSPGLSFMNGPINDLLNGVGGDDYYALSLAAYDYHAAQNKQAKLVWRTRIGTPSIGYELRDSLPKMIAIAAPFIGRDYKDPVRVLASDHYTPDVQYGTATVVPESDSGRETK